MQKRRAKQKVIRQSKLTAVFDDILADETNLGMGYQIPPLIGHVAIYFYQHSMDLPEAQNFFQHHENMEWKTVTGRPQKKLESISKGLDLQCCTASKVIATPGSKTRSVP